MKNFKKDLHLWLLGNQHSKAFMFGLKPYHVVKFWEYPLMDVVKSALEKQETKKRAQAIMIYHWHDALSMARAETEFIIAYVVYDVEWRENMKGLDV